MSAARVWMFGSAEDCDVVVDSPYASSRHCQVERIGARGARTEYRVRDLGSTNGTIVRRGTAVVQVKDWFYLAPDDILIVGRAEFTVDDLQQLVVVVR